MDDNEAILADAGLLQDSVDVKFVSEIFVSISPGSRTVPLLCRTVPLLQTVYQSDAAHTNVGKYSLYSCYGIDFNANTFPVCIAIIFDNEDKEGWVRFWQFVIKIIKCVD